MDAGLLRSPQSAAVESHRRLRWITILCAGQARRSSRCMAQSLRSGVSPEAERVPTGKPSRRAGPVSPEVSSRHRRACADCFRSQLRRLGFGRLTRRDPGKAVRTYHEGCSPTFKTGTFYLAGSRNFLFGSNRGVLGVLARIRLRAMQEFTMQQTLYVGFELVPQVRFGKPC